MASSDALPVPRKNLAYRVAFPGLKNDGTLITSGTGMDSEVSKDGGTFTDCDNEASEIATTSGVYTLDLTSTEMNADMVIIKTTWTNTDALPTVLVLYPQETGDIHVTADNADIVTFVSPIDPETGDLTLYDDTDYTTASGVTLPTWTSDAWSVFDLTNATSIKFYYRARNTGVDTELGTITALDDTTIRFTADDAAFAAVPYGNKSCGFKIVAVLDVAHGSAEVQLVNAALSHRNYTAVR